MSDRSLRQATFDDRPSMFQGMDHCRVCIFVTHVCFKSFDLLSDRSNCGIPLRSMTVRRKLFQGMDHCRVCIVLSNTGPSAHDPVVATTRYHKRYKDESLSLLDLVHYRLFTVPSPHAVVPKLRSEIEVSIYQKVLAQSKTIGGLFSAVPTQHRIYYKITGVGHWFTFTTSPPRFWRDGVQATSTRESSAAFASELLRDTAFCCLWSTLHYWLYQARTNCRDFNPSDLAGLPIPNSVADGLTQFRPLAHEIMSTLSETSAVTAATL